MDNYPARERYKNQEEASLYDNLRFTSLKGRLMDYFEKRSIIKCLDKIGKIESIMDIPAGTGRITELLLDRAKTIIAGDISDDMLNMAKKKFQNTPNITYIKIDAENMELSGNYVECITCVRLMGHVPPDTRVKMLSEMARVSNKWVIVTYYFSNIVSDLKRSIRRIVTKNKAPWFPTTAEDLMCEIKSANLDVEEIHHVLPLLSESVTYLMKKTDEKT